MRAVIVAALVALASGCTSTEVVTRVVQPAPVVAAPAWTEPRDAAPDLIPEVIRIKGAPPTPTPEPAPPPPEEPERPAALPPEPPAPPTVASLARLAQAFEDAGKEEDACAAYRLLLGASSRAAIPAEADLDELRMLAHEVRAWSALGKYEWTVSRSAHFIVFTESRASGVDVDAFERARDEALERLGLEERRVPRSACVPVFIFEDQCGIVEVAGMDWWAAGCAAYTVLDFQMSRTIFLVRQPAGALANSVQHEIAHVFAGEAFRVSLPSWAAEGVACHAEKDYARQWLAEGASAVGGIGKLEELLGATASALPTERVHGFYCRSFVLFETLVDQMGSVEAAVEAASRLDSATAAELSALERAVSGRLAPSEPRPVPIERAREVAKAGAGAAAYAAIAGLGLIIIVIRLRVRRTRPGALILGRSVSRPT